MQRKKGDLFSHRYTFLKASLVLLAEMGSEVGT